MNQAEWDNAVRERAKTFTIADLEKELRWLKETQSADRQTGGFEKEANHDSNVD
jgi:hypothetical protein